MFDVGVLCRNTIFSSMANRKITSLNSVAIQTCFTLQLATGYLRNSSQFQSISKKVTLSPLEWMDEWLKLITLMVNLEIDLNNFF